MANPDPEILPEEITDIAAVVATGRSDYRTKSTMCLPFLEYSEGHLTLVLAISPGDEDSRRFGNSGCIK